LRQFGNILWLPNLRVEDDIKPQPISALFSVSSRRAPVFAGIENRRSADQFHNHKSVISNSMLETCGRTSAWRRP
jgi:hypothetical protein